MNKKSNLDAQILIFLASLVLVAMSARAEEKVAQNQNMKLIWTSDCPKGISSTSNTNLCRKKIYVDDSIDVKTLKWEEVEDIAKISYDWKYRMKKKFKKKS